MPIPVVAVRLHEDDGLVHLTYILQEAIEAYMQDNPNSTLFVSTLCVRSGGTVQPEGTFATCVACTAVRR